MPPSIRLAIAAPHAAVATALLRRIEAAAEHPVEGRVVTGLEDLRAELGCVQPCIALLDGDLTGFEPAGAVCALRAAHRAVPVVVLLSRVEPVAELALARAGAAATLAWGAPTEALLRVLRIVAAGSSCMSTAALMVAMPPAPANGVPASVALPPLPTRPIEPLTERETIILARIQRGESNRTIGDALGIDENRVKIHLRTIFRKTGARNRTEAALRASAAVARAAAADAAAQRAAAAA
jgi:DNA-binding NarL/FixJ family response regulator